MTMKTPNTQQEPDKRSRLRTVLAGWPTLVVLGGIGAVGFWGHHTGWKASKFSELFGSRASVDSEDWCLAHNVPDSKCIACHPELAGESGADWCKEHGVPESRCTVCHPEILETGVAGDWCTEHGLPESGCTLCHPEIARKSELPLDESGVVVTNGTGEHPSGASALPNAAVRDPRTCQTHVLKVQFASVASIEKAGVRLGKVVERPMSDSVFANAEVDFNRTRFARVSSRVPGTAARVEHELGDHMRAGDLLALIDSAAVGQAKADFLQAVVAVELTSKAATRAESSSAAGFRTEADRSAAEASAREAGIQLFNARQALVNLGLSVPAEGVTQDAIVKLGLPETVLKTMPTGVSSANLLPLLAPFDGIIVSRDILVGDVVDPAKPLFEIADTQQMWVTMDVPQSDAYRITLGQEMSFRLDDARDQVATGAVTWMSTAADEMTRTVKVRAAVTNADGSLRAHTFGRARIVVRTNSQAIAVPTEAVQWEGCCYIVFVRLSDEIFQTRKVRLGTKDAAFTEIIAGVLPGEVVATAGSHVLKSEILKSNLGAGCTDD